MQETFAPETQPPPAPCRPPWAGARWRFSALPALRYRVGRRGAAADPPVARLALPSNSPPPCFSAVSRPQRPRGCRPRPLPPFWLVGSRPARLRRSLGLPLEPLTPDGSSLPTTARPSSRVTLPASDDGRGHVPAGHRPRLPAATPSALKGTWCPSALPG